MSAENREAPRDCAECGRNIYPEPDADSGWLHAMPYDGEAEGAHMAIPACRGCGEAIDSNEYGEQDRGAHDPCSRHR